MLKTCIGIVALILVMSSPAFSDDPLDPAASQLLETILWYQHDNGLTPYAVEDNVTTGSDYTWALWMMAIVAAEKNGYLSRKEAVSRLGKMLKTIDGLDKYKGWLYWGYHLETLEPDSTRLGFQGWYLYSLMVIKNVYPELRELAESLLFAVDYSVVYDEEGKFLSDYIVDEDKRAWRIPLGPLPDGSDTGHPASERRVAYVAYSYITKDLSPWLLDTEPNFQELEGLKFLSVWAHYNFDIAHLHYVLPEVGYFEKSWSLFLEASKRFIQREGLKFFPTRSGTLEDGLWNPMYPNTEHREAMPWITWYLDSNAPVMQYCYKPDYGLFRYYDQWNFYWSYGTSKEVSASIGSRPGHTDIADSAIALTFFVNTNPRFTKSPKLTNLSFEVSYPDPNKPPLGALQVFLNSRLIATVEPSEIAHEPTLVTRKLDVLLNSVNEIVFKNSDKTIADFNRFELYSADKQVSYSEYSYRPPELSLTEGLMGYDLSEYGPVQTDRRYRGPVAEVICEGQNIGPAVEDTCTAFLIRIGVMHDYYVWKSLVEDKRYLDTMVAWVGSYTSDAKLARVIHNVSDSQVMVRYERPKDWKDEFNIEVTELNSKEKQECNVSGDLIYWEAKPYTTYYIRYQEGE